MELEFNAEKHEYRLGDKPLMAVTTLLRLAGLVNFDAIPERDRQFYMERGTANHRHWQMVEEGTADGFDFDERVLAYKEAHAKFLRDTGFKALPGGIEMRVHSDDLGIAGTIDRLGTIQGRVVLADYKTTRVYPSTAMQTALYLLCLPGYKFHEVERYGIAFRNDGTYRMSEKYKHTDEREAIAIARKYAKGENNGK